MRLPEFPGLTYEAVLGEDPFGWNLAARNAAGKSVAVKVFKAQATHDRFFVESLRFLKESGTSLRGIVPLHDYQLPAPGSPAACVTPLYGWRGKDDPAWQISSLARVREWLSPEQCRSVIRDLAEALSGLHRARQIHAGIRPDAIFLAGNEKGGQTVYLGEFGQGFMTGVQFLEAGEVLFYSAPEQLQSGEKPALHGMRWDIYAFGVVAFELLTGHLPRLDRLRRHYREHPDWLDTAVAITFGELSEVSRFFIDHLANEAAVEWPESTSAAVPAHLRELIGACLLSQPEDRPASMVEVAERLRQVEAPVLSTPAAAAPRPEPAKPASAAKTAPLGKSEAVKAAAKPTILNENVAPADADRAQPLAAANSASPAVPAAKPESVFESVLGLDPTPDRVSRPRPGFLEALRTRPVLRWQISTIAAVTTSLVLTGFAFVNYLEARSAKQKIETDLARERQTTYRQQAATYTRMQSVESEKQKLTAELNKVADSQSELMGQTKLARQLLRENQESGDRFFEVVIDNRNSDVSEFRAARAGVIEKARHHYERLVETYGDAPDFIVSTANAFFYLGRIYRELGEFRQALDAFSEAERRYAALLEQDGAGKVDFIRNIAISKRALGELSIRSAEYSVARHYFTEASRFWSEARAIDPAIADEAALRIHESSLDIVECEFAMDRADAALDAASSVGVRLTEMQKAHPGDHRVVGALARSFMLVGRVLESRRELDLAREAYQQSSDLYAKAVGLDASVDDYQLGLGNSLARVGLLANDTEKLQGAAEVLGRVVASNPYESIYLKTLADIYGTLALGQRDGGKIAAAVELEKKAITILRPIIESNAAVASDVRFSYAQRLAHLAELLGDSRKFDESRVPLKEAITVLEKLSTSEGSVAEYHRALARTRGLAGFACIKSGDPGEARAHLELAKANWQTYMASHPDDDSAAEAVKWTAEQLSKLQ